LRHSTFIGSQSSSKGMIAYFIFAMM
jgi:hypothetical protein